MSRLFIAALQVSLDGYLQGANGEVDWVDSWGDALGLVQLVSVVRVHDGPSVRPQTLSSSRRTGVPAMDIASR